MVTKTTFSKTLSGFMVLIIMIGAGLPTVWAQSRTITGRVISSDEGAEIPGVNIILKGTNYGTTTNIDGDYTIEAQGANPVLVFSFIGYQSQETEVGVRSMINISLVPEASQLGEVVVTALGIRREEISLGYSIGRVGGEELNRVVQENVLNGLAGKVAGVTVSSTGGTGSSVSMVIRGATSLSSDNQPLFVIDGVPIANTLNNVTQIGSDNRVDYGNAISGLNPDDIAEVTILKGPSAAALYGSRAGNGVVLITTKRGNKVNKMTVNINSNTVFDIPFKFLKWQTQYGSGQFSAIPPDISGTPLSNPFGSLVEENAGATFGAELDRGYFGLQWNSPIGEDGKPVPTELVSYPNNVRNFVQTGVTTTNGFSVANNNDNINYRLSYSNMQNKGIIPNSDLFRNTLNLNSGLKLNQQLTLSTHVDFSRNSSNNRPAGERGTNPLQWAYSTSPHVNILEMKDYWLPGQEGLQQKTVDANYKSKESNNPYFLAKEVQNSFVRDRVFGNIKLDYQLSDNFSLMARYSLDTYKEKRESKIANSYTKEINGAYGLVNLEGFESNADFLATYANDFNKVSFSASVGGNTRFQQGSSVYTATKSGAGLITPGVYTLQNIAPDNIQYSSSKFERGINSVYALMNLGFQNLLFLDLTARNDWSSTLPGADSYFYPSAAVSWVLSEMLKVPRSISLIKLRVGMAEVGNDANPYQLMSTLGNAGAWGNIPRLSLPGTLLNPFLKPEIARSYEAGLDLGFFSNRLSFSGTYYKVENKNQIFSTGIPPSTGYTAMNINAGLLESQGFELTLGGTPIQSAHWNWDLNFNLTRNRTRIIELSDELPYFTLWTDAKGGAWTYVGDEIGDIYDAQVVTVQDTESPYYGYPILDQTGKWQSIDAINTKNKIGNFNPDFILGGQTTLSYKSFSLSLSFDWRKGGEFVSQTYRYGEEDGRSQLLYDKLINPGEMSGKVLRDYLIANQETLIRLSGNNFPLVGGPTPDTGGYPFVYGPYTLPYGGVFIPGVYASGYDDDGNPTGYIENLGENIGKQDGTLTMPYAGGTAWSFTRAFLYDASFVKLREISLGYDLPRAFAERIRLQNAHIAVYSRNIMLWTAAKINIDPEMAFQPQAGTQAGTQFKQGIERYNVMPWVMPVGVKLSATF